MALSRAAGLCRLALRTQWAFVRLLSSVAAGGEPPGDEDKKRGRLVDLEALRRERALRPPAERTPLVPSRKAHRQFKPTAEQLRLNKDIGACASAEAVLDLVSLRLAVLNEVNAATALMSVARRVEKGNAASLLSGDARFAQLLAATASLFARMAPQELSNAMYACGQLGIRPPAEWLLLFWDASASKLDGFVPQGLSNVIYACGQLGITPPADWLQRYWHIFELGDFDSQDFSNTLYACGQLGLMPPVDWLQRFWNASSSKLGTFVPQGLSNTMYACGELSISPPADWLQHFWHASASKLGVFSTQDLSNTLYACNKLGSTPPGDWLMRFWHASAPKLGDFKPQGMSNTLYACGQLGITPPADWLQRYWHTSALKLGEFSEQGFANAIYACGQLGITPPADWLQRFWHASGPRLGEFVPQGLSNVLLACAKLDIRPPPGWLQSFSGLFERSLPNASRQDLSNTALSLTTLGLWELPLWRSLWEQLYSSLPRNPADWSAENKLNARQLYQAYQAAAAERRGLLSAPDPEVLAAARKSWIDGMDDRSSRLHADVSACLRRMGVAHANERWCERAERSIDIAIDGAGTPVALEVDGPSHFLQDGRQDGSTQLRNRMLAAHGWRVAVVYYRAWNALKTDAQREEYLRRLLA